MTETPSQLSYELALLQFRPDVTSEELVNVGVVALSAELFELSFAVTERYGRLKAVYADIDGVAFRNVTRRIRVRSSNLAKELKKLHLHPKLDSAPYSVQPFLDQIVQPGGANFSWSSIRYGVCSKLEERVQEVFHEYIGRHEQGGHRERIDDDKLWKRVLESPHVNELVQEIAQEKEVASKDYSYTFRASWTNGHLQVAEPISLDYLNPGGMVEQAVRWTGILHLLTKDNDFDLTAIVTDPPYGDPEALKKYNVATALLSDTERIRAVIPASDLGKLKEIIEADLLAHE